MVINRPAVGGPEFSRIVADATEKVARLEANNWDFDSVPEVFAQQQQADVIGKEAVHMFDGRTMTRVGRLVLGGVGEHFNLMGTFPANSTFKVATEYTSHVLDQVHQQAGTQRLRDLPEYAEIEERYGAAEEIEFSNYGLFYRLNDLIQWLLVHDAGCFPSTLESIIRRFAQGNVVQNNMYSTKRPSKDPQQPAIMRSPGLLVQFPSKVVEWMELPIFGGLVDETIKVEHLLTVTPTDISHPFLPLVLESRVRIVDQDYYLRTYSGSAPKEALRGPGVAQEGPAQPDDRSSE
ncbi:MAG TPA: hypothetical protein VF069_07660 [Streptosporangiaceae bacterium]